MKQIIYHSILLFLLQLIAIEGHSQINLVDQNTIGGSDNDYMKTSTILNDGSVVVGGYSWSGISGDKSEANYGFINYWIMQLAPNLSINWQKTIGGDSSDILTVLVNTSDGGFICGGYSYSSIAGNKTEANIGGNDYWIVKCDNTGAILWQKVYGGVLGEQLQDIVELANGDLILAGNSNSGISGDKTESSRGFDDYWILRVNSSGTIIWDKTIGGSYFEILGGVAIDADENIYLAGTSASGISGEKTEDSYGSNDIWVVKLDPSGTLVWDKSLGGSLSDGFGDILVKGNYLYVLANSSSGVSGTKTDSCRGQLDYWVNKLDFDGNVIWDKTIGGSAYEMPGSIMQTNDDQLIIAGSSSSGLSGDKTEASKGCSDMWAVSIDTSGTILWQKTIGGSGCDNVISIQETSDNNYLFIGDSDSNISGDKTENSQGASDYWIVQVSSMLGLETEYIADITIYPNPTSDQVHLSGDFEGNIQIFVVDNSGRLILDMGTFTSNTITFDVHNWQKGIYFVNLFTDGTLIGRTKLVVN